MFSCEKQKDTIESLKTNDIDFIDEERNNEKDDTQIEREVFLNNEYELTGYYIEENEAQYPGDYSFIIDYGNRVLHIVGVVDLYTTQIKAIRYVSNNHYILETVDSNTASIEVLNEDGDVYVGNSDIYRFNGSYEKTKSFQFLPTHRVSGFDNDPFDKDGNFVYSWASVTVYEEPGIDAKRQSVNVDGGQYLLWDARVELLEIGIEDTINNVTAPWVKIRTNLGYEAWCFSGYLKPLTEVDSVDIEYVDEK
jgi:hypothetical protein